MSLTSRFDIGLTFGLLLSLSTPFIIPAISYNSSIAIAQAQTQPTQTRSAAFSDVPADYWAHDYIAGLAKANVISGFGDGTFRPNEWVTRAQFAAILRKAFLQSQPTTAQAFADVPANYWATDAIYAARSASFLSGYPGNRFAPSEPIRRQDALISLASGLKYAEGGPDALSEYWGADSLPSYALPGIRAAAKANIIVSYPDIDNLSLGAFASRADVSAFVYQALVQAGRVEPLAARDRWPRKPVVTLPTFPARMSLSQTGQRLATTTANYTDDGPEYGKSFQIWNTQTGQLIKEITAPDQTRFDSIAIAHDGKQVATISTAPSTHATQLSVWTVATGELLWQKLLDAPQQTDYPFYFGRSLVQVAFAPDNSEIVTRLVVGPRSGSPANNQLRFYQVATGEVVQSLDNAITGGTRITQIAFSPNGQFFVSAKQDAVNVWRLNEENRFEFLRTLPIGGVEDMVFVSNDTLNVSTLNGQYPYTNGQLDAWNVRTGEEPSSPKYTEWDRTDAFTRLSPDGKYYFVRGDVAGSRLNNVQTGETQSPQVADAADMVAFSEDGSHLAIATIRSISIFTKRTASNP